MKGTEDTIFNLNVARFWTFDLGPRVPTTSPGISAGTRTTTVAKLPVYLIPSTSAIVLVVPKKHSRLLWYSTICKFDNSSSMVRPSSSETSDGDTAVTTEGVEGFGA